MTELTEHLSEQQFRSRADKLIADINYAELADFSKESIERLYAMFDRLNERAIAAGYGAL